MSGPKSQTESLVHRLLEERAGRLRQSVDEAVRVFVQPIELPPEASEATDSSSLQPLRALRDALATITAGRSQREILTALLGVAATCYTRTALFVNKGETLLGWAGRGFDSGGGIGDGDLPRVALPAHSDHILARALQSRALVVAGSEGPGNAILSALGKVQPSQAAAMPLLLRDHPVAILYGDSTTPEGSAEALWFEVIGQVGGLALGNLAADGARRARAETAGTTGAAAAPANSDSFSAGSTPGSAASGADDAELPTLLTDMGDSKDVGTDAAPGSAPATGEDKEARRGHEDARRFASLLVSELLLYNEEAVIQGRKNRDLSRRLSMEIQRSRQAYKARVPSAVAHGTSFLEDELVRVLADGDASLLSA